MAVLNATTGVQYASLSAAISASSANDLIQISAGTYVEDFPDITHNLTIESFGGMSFLSTLSPTPVNGRAVLNVPGDQNVSLTISGLAISGAVDSASNGAGILFESGNANLNITDSWFFNNQEGVLVGGTDAADPGGMFVSIKDSEFSNNGLDPSNARYGLAHNLYVNGATQLVVTGSYFHDALGGHEIKSRAQSTIITNNRIQDGPTAQTSYSIDLSNGGADTVSGNVIEKGPNSVNKYVVAFAAERPTYPGSSLLVSGNTIIDGKGGSVVVLNDAQDAAGHTIPASIENNTLYNFSLSSLNEDTFGAPLDVSFGNLFLPGPGPVLDTSQPFTACFAAGTHIATSRGPVAVERLQPGDRVRTAAGDLAPVQWLGHRRIACRTHPRPQDVLPVRIRAGAFGPGQPLRDLRLSPDHAVFVDGVLIPVRYLLNGATIVQESVAAIVYHHVELAAHDVILAEGLACESYLDTGNRGAFSNGGAAIDLHPDFARRVWGAKACAPLVLEGPQVVAARRHLLAQAEALGHARTDDPGLLVLAEGSELPATVAGRIWHVRVPAGVRDLRFASRVWVPAHTRPAEADPRALGVAIAHIWLDWREASLDSAGLGRGWYAPESGFRWTDGDAGLAVAGVRELVFEIAMTGTYWQAAPRRGVRAA